jgi:hypothetical protein
MRIRVQILVVTVVMAVVAPQGAALASSVATTRAGAGGSGRHTKAADIVRAASTPDNTTPPSLPSPSLDPSGGPLQWFTPTTRSIRNTDGTVSTYMYTGPTFHQIGDRWSRIDPTISVDAAAGGMIGATNGLVPTTFGVTPRDLASPFHDLAARHVL